MKVDKTIGAVGLGLLLGAGIAGYATAQTANPLLVTPQSQFKPMPMPAIEKPAQAFKTAEEHYKYLLKQANGGTKHTQATIPDWSGLWTSGANSMTATFLVSTNEGALMSPGGTVREGILTPAYEKQFKARRAEIGKLGQQKFDRLTRCAFPGAARWLWEPYVKEFANTPTQTWMMNDFMNETRRVYLGSEHVNIDAKHSATGDSIGFWDKDKLIVWTKWINPADYTRGMPLTSNQLQMVETWQLRHGDKGAKQLTAQVTYYDPLSLVKPISLVYLQEYRPDLEKIGVRIRNWECATSSNDFIDAEGNTSVRLPGDPEYKDPRGSTDYPDLPGQDLDPIFDPGK